MIEVGPNAYGKQAIRLVKVVRSATPHRIYDLTIGITLEGDFVASYADGDNSGVIATDTMKNTTYALAADRLQGSIEEYGIALGRHFLAEPQVGRATVSIEDHAWRPIGDAPDAFARDGSLIRTARLSVGRDGLEVRAGIADLIVMKTTRSAFRGFPRDRFTTLAETDDRILATKVRADWRYEPGEGIDHDAVFEAIRSSFLDAFADHDSESVQESIWIVGRAMLERHPGVSEVSMSLPNLHHWTVDLQQFGIDNDRTIYVSTTEPHGLIEATIRRGDPGPGTRS